MALEPGAFCNATLGRTTLCGYVSLTRSSARSLREDQVLMAAGFLRRRTPPGWAYSVGRWEGDTLVFTTAGYNDRTWLDFNGHPHSEALRTTERFHRRDFGHMDVEMTFEDPQTYAKPFTIKVPHDLLADSDIFEMFCNENEKDRTHLQKQ